MLQSEFYDRTHVSLSAEEYGEVENIYNRVQMNKDEFCQLWLKNRDNKIIKELMVYILNTERKLYAANEQVSKCVKAIEKERDECQDRIEFFGRKIVTSIYDDARIYDACEEVFGLDFICKVKLNNNIDLEQHEREHLLKKL